MKIIISDANSYERFSLLSLTHYTQVVEGYCDPSKFGKKTHIMDEFPNTFTKFLAAVPTRKSD
jgi:hypothetical protein